MRKSADRGLPDLERMSKTHTAMVEERKILPYVKADLKIAHRCACVSHTLTLVVVYGEYIVVVVQ